MKAIRCMVYILSLLLLISSISCSEDDTNSNAILDSAFIRFSFKTDSNGQPIQFPNDVSNQPELEEFEFKKRDTLKLPVTLSVNNLENSLEAEYSVTFNAIEASDVLIFTRSNQLKFETNQLSDTIYIVPQKRLTNLNSNASIDFQITSVDDSRINIGYPNTLKPLDNFKLLISDFDPITYQFSSTDKEIQGVSGESYNIDISFDQIVDPQDVNSLDWLSSDFIQSSCSDELNFDFDFDLDLLALESPSKSLSYRLEIKDNFEDLPTNLNLRLNSVENDNLLLRGQNLVQFFKTGEAPERSGDPASAFYNVSDRFHRTFGKAWILDANSNECEWRDFQSFTRPVEVEPGSEFDNGNGFHRYKIGFRSINRNPNGDIIGTNPFNLRRFYEGASVFSPAFTQTESLEFFPESNTKGSVKVSIQNLEFIVDDQIINIPVCGSGTYSFDAANDRWEIILSIITDESQLNGHPNAEKFLYIYTELVDEDPPLLNGFDCATPVAL